MTTKQKVRVAVAGAAGKMGREAVAALSKDDRFEVVAVLVRPTGQAQGEYPSKDIPAYTNSEILLTEIRPDIWVDFTDAASVVAHVDQSIAHGVRPIIGATGYTDEDLKRWRETCEAQGLGAIAAPNFALGALLMIRFAKEAARLFANVEIIELHHDGKKDAPSGTAKRTANAIIEERAETASGLQVASTALSGFATDAKREEMDAPSRGLAQGNIHIHSVRLPGLVAHQEVIFGGEGETLTIRHDSISRTSFMHGLRIACEHVMNLQSLVYGLENLLW